METGVTDSNHRIRQNAGNLYFQKLSDDKATATDRIVLDGGTGNVGIGFTSPQAKLQVLDQLKVSTSDQSQGVVALGDGSSTQFGVGIARWNGSSNSGGAGGLGYFSQGTVNSGGHFFYTGDAAAGSTTERMRIDSSGDVRLAANATGAALIKGVSGDQTSRNVGGYPQFTFVGNEGTGIRRPITNILAFDTSGDERMRIDDSGNLLVGTTSALSFGSNSNEGVMLEPNTLVASRAHNGALYLQRSASDGGIAYFYKEQASVGNISVTGSATSYNTSSDGRLKDITGKARGLEVINELNPVAYNWKADGKADEGLIAQEVMDIVPNAVSGSEEEMYQMDYSKLVVHLVAGMKEQQTIIDDLKSRIETLEG